MPSILASSIIDKAEIVLQDVANIHSSQSELLGWLNDAQREIAILKPESTAVTKTIQLATGTRQSLGTGSTSDAYMLLKVVRNMGAAGVTPGNAIRNIPGEVLDANRPGWHSESASPTVQNLIYDPRTPTQFYVYPPNSGSYVEIVYSALPAEVTAVGNAITISDIFANAIVDYILYRAYSKDTDHPGNAQRAVAHYQAFTTTLGVNSQNIMANSPNLARAPFAPEVPGAAS